MVYDFGGYVTRNNLKCGDWRIIKADAFKHNDGQVVPLVWQHMHDDPENVLGNVLLENRQDGVYGYASFNETPKGLHAKAIVKHKDVNKLSIYANQLRQTGDDVYHGNIREVSLVFANSNPGAYIEDVSMAHGEGYEILADEVIIHSGVDLELEHTEKEETVGKTKKTLQDVYDTLNDEQKELVEIIVSDAIGETEEVDDELEQSEKDTTEDHIEHSDEGGTLMHHNVFEGKDKTDSKHTLTHAQIREIFADADKIGSLKESFLSHAVTYGIEDISILFPDATKIRATPDWVKRRTEWVAGVIDGSRHTPFSRIKSQSADITLDTARAKGYVKGTMKKEEFFKVSQRTTTPTTIYKKQKLDRDDIIDITDFDVVAWLKAEMRVMLEEELARAILFGDGREIDDPDKINEDNIRPIAYDSDFYSHKVTLPANVSGDVIVESILRARSNYKGTGTPTLYTTEAIITDLILLKDKIGRRLYNSESELATAMRVSRLVPVEALETKPEIVGIMVNIADYVIGADKGGQLAFFDDFDIDYNQNKYLYETRLSGALTLPKSAVVIRRAQGTLATPTVPTFVASTGVVTIPTVTGVDYYSVDDTLTETKLTAGAQEAIAAGATITIIAKPKTDYYFPHNFDADWDFTRNAA